MNKKLEENDFLNGEWNWSINQNILEFLKLHKYYFLKRYYFVALDLPTSPDLYTNKLIATTLSGIAEIWEC